MLPDAPLAAADDPTMRAWYERGGRESPAAVAEALAALDGFVKDVIARIRVPSGRALLAGFVAPGAGGRILARCQCHGILPWYER